MKFKMFTAGAFTVLAFTTVAAQPPAPVTQESERAQQIHLQNGRLYVNQELVHKGFSVMQDRFTFLYFYVPSRGLFTVSNREFEGAAEDGAFQGDTLSLSVGGIDVALKSSSQILKEEASPAWVKFDPEFKLDINSVMFGYGNKEKAPYEWPAQIKKNRD
ncbi:MAG: hypothetical protein QOJ76_1581 [Acidobacteriota bacterium]|jgi:hypothetical protein|nr:hypothetical protein [Acidobacteriota bacterium]